MGAYEGQEIAAIVPHGDDVYEYGVEDIPQKRNSLEASCCPESVGKERVTFLDKALLMPFRHSVFCYHDKHAPMLRGIYKSLSVGRELVLAVVVTKCRVGLLT